MKKITKKQFLADVMHEIDMLKLHATNEEKARLNFNYFDPTNTRSCIYGQMTGNCKSSRASELIGLSCIRIVKNYGDLDSFDAVLPYVNGEYQKNQFEKGRPQIDYLSSLEGYIMIGAADNKQIISYIKGETDTLKLQ